MGGEGFMFSAIASLKNNRGELRRSNPFRSKVKDLHVHHIDSHESKNLSKQEMLKLRIKLQKEKIKDQKILVFTFLALVVVLVIIVVLINGLTIF